MRVPKKMIDCHLRLNKHCIP